MFAEPMPGGGNQLGRNLVRHPQVGSPIDLPSRPGQKVRVSAPSRIHTSAGHAAIAVALLVYDIGLPIPQRRPVLDPPG